MMQAQTPLRSKVFLCHSSHDKAAVRELYHRLRSDGFDPWLDEEDLLPGQAWESEIRKALRRSAAVVVCLSKRSIATAGFVQKEISLALDIAAEQPDGQIFLIPAKLEECSIPERLAHWHVVSLFEPAGYQRLIRALSTKEIARFTPVPAVQVRLLVHRARFLGDGPECFFINATNLTTSDIELTHVWLATTPEVHVLNEQRLLPKRLAPQESWETWINVETVPIEQQEEVYTLARARLSSGDITTSTKNLTVPRMGFVPGGPVAADQRAHDDQGNENLWSYERGSPATQRKTEILAVAAPGPSTPMVHHLTDADSPQIDLRVKRQEAEVARTVEAASQPLGLSRKALLLSIVLSLTALTESGASGFRISYGNREKFVGPNVQSLPPQVPGADWQGLPAFGRPVSAIEVFNGRLFVATSKGGIYRLDDTTRKWEDVSDTARGRDVVTLHSSGESLYAGYNSYGTRQSGLAVFSMDKWIDRGLTNWLVHAIANSGSRLHVGGYGGYFTGINPSTVGGLVPVVQGLPPSPAINAIEIVNGSVFAGLGPNRAGQRDTLFVLNREGTEWSNVRDVVDQDIAS